MQVQMRAIGEIKPYEKNTKKHDKTQIDNVAESIRQYGWAQPLVVDKDDNLIIGHCRLLAAKKLGLREVPCVSMDDLTPQQVKALRIVDNKSNESDWDLEMLLQELPEVDLSAFDFDFELEEDTEEDDENPYTMNENAPIYEIQGEEPKLDDLCCKEKAEQLIQQIEVSEAPENVKDFLRYAAYRHLRFNYAKIAEYYAHAEKEVQELFEASALVIIDYDSAIKNGFVKLSKKIREMRDEG